MALAIGRTVGELQNSMTVGEVMLWNRYREKNGSLSPQRMYDRGAAVVASTISRVNGGKSKVEDFMLMKPEPKSDKEVLNKLISSGAKIATGKREAGIGKRR